MFLTRRPDYDNCEQHLSILFSLIRVFGQNPFFYEICRSVIYRHRHTHVCMYILRINVCIYKYADNLSSVSSQSEKVHLPNKPLYLKESFRRCGGTASKKVWRSRDHSYYLSAIRLFWTKKECLWKTHVKLLSRMSHQ